MTVTGPRPIHKRLVEFESNIGLRCKQLALNDNFVRLLVRTNPGRFFYQFIK